jgi:hypothetical protein
MAGLFVYGRPSPNFGDGAGKLDGRLEAAHDGV